MAEALQSSGHDLLLVISYFPVQLEAASPQTLQLSLCKFTVDPTVMTFFSSGHPVEPCGFCSYFLSCSLKCFCKRSLPLSAIHC